MTSENSPTENLLHFLSLDTSFLDAEASFPDGGGWFGRMDSVPSRADIEAYVRAMLDSGDAADLLNGVDWERLARITSVVLGKDSDGFESVRFFRGTCLNAWANIEREVEQVESVEA